MGKYQKKVNRSNKIIKVVIYILILSLAVTITAISQRAKHEKKIEEINAKHEEEMDALRDELYGNYVSQMAELEQYYEYGGDVTEIEREAECIAKVMYGYGIASNHSNSISDNKAIAWCAINRTEHYAYPDSIAEVCEQPKQWMGYSSDNPVLTEYYDLALEELKTWHNGGHRPMSNDYIYLSWSSKEIILRDTFEENKSTKYWRMK